MPNSPTPTQQQTFNAAYLASQPPEIAALLALPDDSEQNIAARAGRAAILARRGFLIDAPIMAFGWDPFLCMEQRLAAGLIWVPSALQPGLGMPGQYSEPGLDTPGTLGPYPTIPPPGSIKVSINLADYPPFNPPPAPIPVPPNQSPIGPLAVGDIYLPNYPATLEYEAGGAKYGEPYKDSTGTYVLDVVSNGMGRSTYWQKQ